MKLIDSNIIIYSGANENSWLREIFYEGNSFFSSISKIEVLGFHQITEEQVTYFSEVFKLLKVLPVDAEEGNIKKVKSLLNPKLLGIIKPVHVNITREDGWTLLMAAACNGHREL